MFFFVLRMFFQELSLFFSMQIFLSYRRVPPCELESFLWLQGVRTGGGVLVVEGIGECRLLVNEPLCLDA